MEISRRAVATRPAERLSVGVVSLICALLVLYPVAFLAATSLNVGSPYDVLPRAIGLANFAVVGEIRQAVFNTFEVAIVATAIALVCGGAIAWAVARTDVPASGAIEQLMGLPYYVTPLVGALAWSELGSANGLLNQAWRAAGGSGSIVDAYSPPVIALVMALFEGSVAFVMLGASMRSMNAALEEASATCGAGRFETLRRITLPILAPAVLGTAIFVFAEMLGSFSVPLVLGLPARFFVLTTVIFNEVNQFPPRYPVAAAIGLYLFAVMAAMIALHRRVTGYGHSTIVGRGFSSRRVRLGAARYGVLAGCAAYLFVAVLLPLLTLIYASLVPVFNGGTVAWTLQNYQQALAQGSVRSAMLNSVLLGLGMALLGTTFMGAVAWIVYRSHTRGGRLLEYVAMLPQSIPRVVFGFGLLVAWVTFPLRIYGTLWLLLIAYATVFLPLGVRTIGGVLSQIDPQLEESAKVCGAGWIRRLRSITLPLARPGLMAAAFLLFIASVREVNSSIFLMGPKSKVISPLIVESWQANSVGLTSAMALLQVAIMFVAVLGLLAVARRLRGGLGE